MDYRRERNRKEKAAYEVKRMLERYSIECGECITREATAEELNRRVKPSNKGIKPFIFYN